jgi:concanavalin A-like lectin/glucanase superfamily protein
MKTARLLMLMAAFSMLPTLAAAQDAQRSWQKPHAKVLPTGDLEWAPEAFTFEAGASRRYIDFERGRDSNPGTKIAPWKHHPWDKNAKGNAAAAKGVHTYVFKRGVIYRGALTTKESGKPGDPIRLTSEPGWGEGDAMFYGSEAVTGWRAGGQKDMPKPEFEEIWHVDLDYTPRCVWMVDGDKITRIALARTPNWKVSNPDEIKSEWFEWENPQWWKTPSIEVPNGRPVHECIDTKNLTESADYYMGAYAWTEFGIMMGTPYPAKVQTFDARKKALGIGGPWYGTSERIISKNRYYLEDKPHYLDTDGEFWFERKGRNGGRLYVRLPGDRDPDKVRVEAARHINLIDSAGVSHLRVSGLTFRFTNVHWDLQLRSFQHKDVEGAVVRVTGSGEDIRISNCVFEHVNEAVRLHAANDSDRLVDLAVTDNKIHNTDHAALTISDSSRWGKKDPPFSTLDRVSVLRNSLYRVGLRPSRDGHGHAMVVKFPTTAEIAGNILDRIYGAGLFIWGGKASGVRKNVPMARILIHHNKVTDPMLNTNDWGGIETWQGGPIYVYNNISGNPGGYWNWGFKPESHNARFGFAYYLDGSFKNYHFNNIAWGKSNELTSPLMNAAAFQEIHSYQNTFFNNTAYKFARGSRRQAAHAGRDKFLGNVWEDISEWTFRHNQPAKSAADGNAAHAGPQKEHFALETNAYANNVFHKVSDKFGVLEPSGAWRGSIAEFANSLKEGGALADAVGMLAPTSPLRDAAAHDFRPAAGSAASERGVKVFVPWSLYETVGEWHFYPNSKDPSRIVDEHWYMAPHYEGRQGYHEQPMYPLKGVNIAAADFVPGPLEDWTRGALKLNGKDQYLVLKNVVLPKRAGPAMKDVAEKDWFTARVPQSMIPGREASFTIKLKGMKDGHMLCVDQNWLKETAFGGYISGVGQQKIEGDGPYTFKVKPGEKNGLHKYLLNVYISPDGKWPTKTHQFSIPVDKGTPILAFDPQVAASSFIIEAYIRTTKPGVIVSKMAVPGSGYELRVGEELGGIELTLAADNKSTTLKSGIKVSDGEWHHVLAELDRATMKMHIFVDGKSAGSSLQPIKATIVGKNDSLANTADLLVGKGPKGNFFAGEIDFLRIARGSLADSQTTIDELYEWQFDGPQLRDFCGKKPKGKRDAGAIEGP